ncbi:hypothetical protein RJ640_011781 [Escallonia rubra]|uniref:Protein NEOXANTHIN-DEFICIENT 1 n=1 Tax=Escallonia rubra TaxID=112253 RepID=A0AA88UCV2_9ASTE|nr:hypothetical protein RJ640_011781 [Escallonia rubra]
MEVEERKTPSGYDKLPWVFKGRQVILYCGTNLCALYQLHLVKAETARVFIPKEFRLVEAFGYTLGGFFLASYDDSPAGTFDEVLVVIAGTVWNPPTSCALQALNLLTKHGVEQRSPFKLSWLYDTYCSVSNGQRLSKRGAVLHILARIILIHKGKDMDSDVPYQGYLKPKNGMDIQVSEVNGSAAADIFNINLATAVPEQNSNHGMGPIIKMSLPSFSFMLLIQSQNAFEVLSNSSLIEDRPNLSLWHNRVRPVSPAKVFGPSALVEDSEQSCESRSLNSKDSTSGRLGDNKRNLSISVMLSKPILALEFNCLKMQSPGTGEVAKADGPKRAGTIGQIRSHCLCTAGLQELSDSISYGCRGPELT